MDSIEEKILLEAKKKMDTKRERRKTMGGKKIVEKN